ncbi:uncharacterized protein PV06_00299 [Exophiala oligosperma]|uniref:Nop14-like protein n=1 Tax=Exophiala oligosperma TaxID=215243 RepID=A0A0D2DYE9_9EURO|nr:uncharacterized protein PV06_00299 [Exophiala oligosperma]KIW47620.1 hypothetical protein PV06_00299 [Exophiala oligosperma]
MAPSQLKQLKASLREHGIRGPQKSKKERQATAKDAQKRNQRHAALESIRERFNAFEVKGPRREKFEVASAKKSQASSVRPGVTRGLGEERRRETLLKEMQSRNKVGGLLDRRFGENDPTMTPEERAAERFARQNERKLRKTSMFNLEDDSEEEMTLTHGGRSLDFGGDIQDDFDEGDVAASDDNVDDFEAQNDRPRKKLRLEDSLDDGSEEDGEMPERRKTKNEVMKEIIAKSKMYKAERQAAKADDDDLRAELDKGMADFYEALRGHKPPEKQPVTAQATEASEPHMDPARAAMLAGKSRVDAEKEYEANLRELKLEARSKPSVRTKTDEEKAAEEAARLEELERKRVRRMKGEAESSDDEDEAELGPDEDFEEDDAEAFGLAAPEATPRQELDVEDEDEFVLDDDLLASDSEAEMASDQDEDDDKSEDEPEDDGDDDFINGLALPQLPKLKTQSTGNVAASNNLAYTFPCPQTHDEFLEVTKDAEFSDLPTIVQRIRALYHKGLAQGNQQKLDVFAGVLSQHVAYLADNKGDVPFSVLESLLRHLHSMAKASPEAVGIAFRTHLESIAEDRALKLSPGDLIILTGISTIFPTSDHFHSVVTPAMLTLGRYLGQSTIQNVQDLGTGAYCCSLSLRYQRLARRHIPEVVTYIVNALAALAPVPLPEEDKEGQPLNIPARLPRVPLRINSHGDVPEKLAFKELVMNAEAQDDSSKRTALLHTFIRICAQSAELWKQKTAFPELISPYIQALSHIVSHPSKLPKRSIALTSSTLQNLRSLRTASIEARKPLLLHNHRPLAIKTAIPAFIENYNPDRHYDPDRQRAELSKLKAEHKKERKGAMRELRKDANFMAREQLREKKEKDAAYDKKFKRLVAEIQGEEGREQKGYDREKKKRQGRF